MQKSLFLIFYVVSATITYGQPLAIKSLNPGDTLPDYAFTIHTGSAARDIRLSDYKGKMIIFDFWDTGCGSCINGMPHMLELQRQMKDKLQIFLVTNDSQDQVRELWKRIMNHVDPRIIEAGQQLSFIISDTLLTGIFPHNVNPLHVLIDTSRVYRAIAYANTTTVQNIQDFLAGKSVQWAYYYLPDIDTVNRRSWVEKRIGFSDHLLQYSIFTRHDEKKFGSDYVKETDPSTGETTAISFINYSIPDLYRIAYFGRISKMKDVVVVESKASDRFYPTKDYSAVRAWIDSNTFCYAVKIPSGQSEDIFSTVKRELDKFFNIESKLENKKIRCLVLKRLPGNADRLRSKSGSPEFDKTFDDNNNGNLKVVNMPVRSLFMEIYTDYILLRSIRSPFLDETGYQTNIDINIPWGRDNYSIDALRRSLQAYDLDIVEEDREMKVLILKENGYKQD